MKIHYHNRKRLNSELENGATYHKSIQSLFSVSEVLSINCPATKETQKIINRKTLKFFPYCQLLIIQICILLQQTPIQKTKKYQKRTEDKKGPVF